MKFRFFYLIGFLTAFSITISQAKAAKRALAFGIPPSASGKGISLKFFPFPAYGIQGIFSFGDQINENPFFRDSTKRYQIQLRALARSSSYKTLSLFSGIGIGFGKERTDSLDKTTLTTSFQQTNAHATNLLVGVEYFFKEFKNLGISAELGFSFEKQTEKSSGTSSSQHKRQFFSSLFGLHYYFK